jgi:hypothetical protein
MKNISTIFNVRSVKHIREVHRKGDTVHVTINEKAVGHDETYTVRLTVSEIVEIGLFVKLKNSLQRNSKEHLL